MEARPPGGHRRAPRAVRQRRCEVSAVHELRPRQQAPTRRQAELLDLLHYRLSSFALALDAVLPELAFLESAVQSTALGLPLRAGGAHRRDKVARQRPARVTVLERPMPPEIEG